MQVTGQPRLTQGIGDARVQQFAPGLFTGMARRTSLDFSRGQRSEALRHAADAQQHIAVTAVHITAQITSSTRERRP